MRALLLSLLLIGAVLWASPAVAQEPTDGPERIVVSPLAYSTPKLGEAGRAAVVVGATRYLASSRDDVQLVGFADMEKLIRSSPTYSANVEVARDWARLGVEKYRQLDSAGAVRDLRQSQKNFVEAGQDYLAPGDVAEVLQFLSLALLEQGLEVTGPLEAMKAMIALDPSTEIKAGAYPDEVVQFYEGARISLEGDLRERGPEPSEVARLAAMVDADYVIFPSVIESTDGVSVVSWMWDARQARFLAPEMVDVSEPSPERLADAANRLTSRHVACLAKPAVERETEEVPRSLGTSPFALQFSGTYGSFFEFPQISARDPVDPFAQLGAGLGASFFLTREFAFFGMFQFLNAQKDFDGQIESGFNTLRFFLGAELGVALGRLRFAVAPLFELMVLGEIRSCIGVDDELYRCRARDRDPADYEPIGNDRVVAGVNARPRVAYQLAPSLGVFVAGSTSFYFAQDDNADPNYLTTVELGFQYRF